VPGTKPRAAGGSAGNRPTLCQGQFGRSLDLNQPRWGRFCGGNAPRAKNRGAARGSGTTRNGNGGYVIRVRTPQRPKRHPPPRPRSGTGRWTDRVESPHPLYATSRPNEMVATRGHGSRLNSLQQNRVFYTKRILKFPVLASKQAWNPPKSGNFSVRLEPTIRVPKSIRHTSQRTIVVVWF
jgi:hypothetical protein